MTNKYLEKLASEQKYRGNRGKPINDSTLAKHNTAMNYAGALIGGPVGAGAKYGKQFADGRSVNGVVREETRGLATASVKGLGYGVAGAAAAGAVGAGVGHLAGNQRVAKAGANVAGKAAEAVKSMASAKHGARVGSMFPGGKQFLDSMATKHPETIKKILSHKRLGMIGGAAMGAAAGLVGGMAVGGLKGEYDGRLASIRNQIRDGSLKNVNLTKSK